MADHWHQSIARRWFSEWAPDPPVYGRATEWLAQVIDHKPERAWAFILRLVDHAPTEDALGWVAAGPLEDLLCDHGPSFIDRVEAMAATNSRFKACLRNVWGANRMDPSTYHRMRRAAGMDAA